MRISIGNLIPFRTVPLEIIYILHTYVYTRFIFHLLWISDGDACAIVRIVWFSQARAS